MTDALQIVLARRPAGDVTPDCFRQESVSLPAPGEGALANSQSPASPSGQGQ